MAVCWFVGLEGITTGGGAADDADGVLVLAVLLVVLPVEDGTYGCLPLAVPGATT